MRAAALFFLTLATASPAALLPHASAVAAEEGAGADATSSRTVPEWFNAPTTEYYTMPQFVVPVIEGNAVTRQITLLVTLETFGAVNREKVMSKRERLQDAFLRDMYGVLAVHRPEGGGYDDALKTRLRRVGDKVVGAGVIRNIFVKTTYDRPLAPSTR